MRGHDGLHTTVRFHLDEVLGLLSMIGIGMALAVPLLYGLSTLLGMTHKEFRPILHRNQPDGTTEPLVHDQAGRTSGR